MTRTHDPTVKVGMNSEVHFNNAGGHTNGPAYMSVSSPGVSSAGGNRCLP